MPGTLYLLPTLLADPGTQGNDLLAQVIPDPVQKLTAGLTYLIAENAKTTRAYLKMLSANTPLAKPLQEIRIAELNVRSDASALPALLAPLQGGMDAGLISEAGVPAVADPGAHLVRLAHRQGIPVKPLVGPSALLLAVMASGLNGQQFAFNGYLPTDTAERAERIRVLEKRSRAERQTQLFIETPYRNGALLDAFIAACRPETLISIAVDLTLPSETIATRTAAQWKAERDAGRGPAFHRKPAVFLLLAE